MSAEFSGATLAEAAAAIQVTQAYRAGRGEKFLNTFGDKILATSDNPVLSAVKNVAASAAFDQVKGEVTHFVETSKTLVRALDEVGKIHPFIQVAVSAFQAAITLELARRENDQKIIALSATMCDMMQVMTLLKKVASPKDQAATDGMSIEQRLQGRMGGVVSSIKRCAKLCDTYQKHNTAVKFFTSLKWQGKFADLAAQFVTHKSNLESDLQIHISITVTNTSDTLASVNEKVSAMTAMIGMVFEKMQTPEEKEWATFARQNGGVDRVLESDELMKKVVEKQKSGAKDEKGPPGKHGQQPATLAEFERELGKDVDTVLAENTKAFEQKFGAMEASLREVNVAIQRQSDRVIEEVLAGMHAGPHERILDKDLYHIWKDMGWKASVKATHLVLALYDHLKLKAVHRMGPTLVESQPGEPAKAANNVQTIAASALPEAPVEDMWALEYITMSKIQPLIEALDDDGSSFVRVNEVNEFTSSRPEGWSLARWVAYWTTGFEMTTNWYWRRIRKNMDTAVIAYLDMLPANRAASSYFFRWWVLSTVDNPLSGLRGTSQWDYVDWDGDTVFSKFKDYVLDEEKKLKTMLRRLSYNIDQDNTLRALTGGDRPEKRALPLLCLLLERLVWTMNVGKTSLVAPNEFFMLGDSVMTVVADMQNRATKLQAVYKLQNMNNKEKLETAFFGIYSCVFESHTKNVNWTHAIDVYGGLPEVDLGELEVPEPPLFYQAESEEIDLFLDSTSDGKQEVTENAVSNPDAASTEATTLVGAWSGTYTHRRGQQGEGLTSFSITEKGTDGDFKGSGIDIDGAFTVDGTIEGSKVDFTKTYTATYLVRRYIGTLDMETGTIVGQWGPPEMETEAAPASAIENETQSNQPEENTEEGSGGDQPSTEQTPPCNIEITVEGPTPGEGETEETKEHEDRDDDDDKVSQVGSTHSAVKTDATEVFADGGSFSLVRRPVDYFLYRPSDAEFQESRPKALWQMVRHAAKQWYRSRHLIWDVLCERRDKRKRYEELFLKQEDTGRLYDADEAAEWAKIIRQTHPNDLRLWRGIIRYKQHRAIKHMEIICDNCGKAVEGSRLLCSDCTEGGWSNSFDLCADCWSSTCSREADDKHHVPTHNLVQLRRPSPPSEHYDYFQYAKNLVNSAKELQSAGNELSCKVCEKVIAEKTFWCCVPCGDGYVCVSCNLRIEEQKPWLLQRKPEPDGSHKILHTLILVTDSEAVASSEQPLTTEKRLEQLEKKLEEQAAAAHKLHGQFEENEKSITERLQKVEDLLERVLAGLARNGHN